MSDTTLPEQYDARDGVDEGMIDQCPHCQTSLHPDRYKREVYDADGRSYDHITATDPNDRPFFCADCWPTLEANRARINHRELTDFA